MTALYPAPHHADRPIRAQEEWHNQDDGHADHKGVRDGGHWPLHILRVQNSRVLSPGFCVFEPNMEVISSKYG